MNLTEFKQNIILELKKKLPTSSTISIQTIQKLNNTSFDAVVIQEEGVHACPAIYLESFYLSYQNGTPLGDICQELFQCYQQSKCSNNIDTGFFLDFQQVKKHLTFRIIHRASNQKMLSSIPYLPFLDLAIVFYYVFQSKNEEYASIQINQSHLDVWHISTQDLLSCAVSNTPKLFPEFWIPLSKIVTEFFPSLQEGEAEETSPVYVATNKARLYGASVILYPDFLGKIAAWLDSDLYLLPSSIHEVLLLPKSYVSNPDTLNTMIREVNASAVAPVDFLSDHYYFYSRETNLISSPF